LLGETLKTQLADVSFLKGNTVEVKPLPKNALVQTWLDEGGTDVMLLVQPHYRLAPTLGSIVVEAWVTIHPRIRPFTDYQDPFGTLPGVIYRNYLKTTYTIPNWPSPPLDLEDSAIVLASEKGKKARVIIDAGMKELAQMIAYDLMQPGTDGEMPYLTPKGSKTLEKKTEEGFRFNGFVVREGSGRTWLRTRTGELLSYDQE